jgi:peptide-methionine (S)-S-oxide reductase
MKEIEDSKVWGKPLVTELTPFKAFYPAEEYHKNYFEKNPYQPYCQFVIAPKVAKLRQHYLDRLKMAPE